MPRPEGRPGQWPSYESPEPEYERSPLAKQPLNESLDQQLLRLFINRLQAEPPTPPPPSEKESINAFHGMFLSRLAPQILEQMMSQGMQKRPGFQEYQKQAAGYEAGQKQLGDIASMARMGQGAGREARLEEQFRWRQRLQSQFKPETRQIYDPNTGLNKWETTYRDPLRNNIAVYQETTDYPPVHYGAVAGPGGEMIPYPTSKVPPAGAMPGGGMVPQGGMPQGPAPAGTPTTGANVTGIVPQGQGMAGGPGAYPSIGRPPTPGNVRGTGVFKEAPSGAALQSIRQQKFLTGLEGAFTAIDAAHVAQVNRFGPSPIGMIGQVAQDKIAQGRYGRAFVSQFGDREVSDYYNKIRLSVYDYVKAQTGAQFSITEMDRYLASFPTTVDDPETAKNLIREHATRAVREINTLKLNWHAMQIGNQRIYVSPDYLDEFLATGGAGALGSPAEIQPTDPAEAILQRYLEKKRAQRP